MTFLGWLSDPFKELSDLQLGDEKGTLNHLEMKLFLMINCSAGGCASTVFCGMVSYH